MHLIGLYNRKGRGPCVPRQCVIVGVEQSSSCAKGSSASMMS
jgi:hypothetical protein